LKMSRFFRSFVHSTQGMTNQRSKTRGFLDRGYSFVTFLVGEALLGDTVFMPFTGKTDLV